MLPERSRDNVLSQMLQVSMDFPMQRSGQVHGFQLGASC